MRRWLVLSWILVLAGILGGCKPGARPGSDGQPAAQPPPSPAAAAGGQQAPELFLVERQYDAGKVNQGDVIKHTFVVKNRGLGELNIEKVAGS